MGSRVTGEAEAVTPPTAVTLSPPEDGPASNSQPSNSQPSNSPPKNNPSGKSPLSEEQVSTSSDHRTEQEAPTTGQQAPTTEQPSLTTEQPSLTTEQPSLTTERPSPTAERAERIATLVVVLLPFVGLLLAIVTAWGWGVGVVELSLFAGMYLATGLGITVGFHRLFTHRAFSTGRGLQALFAILGSMAVQGPLLRWVATHRSHHRHSDKPADPHSPNQHGGGRSGIFRGLWWAHMGWMLEPFDRSLNSYLTDFRGDVMVQRLSALFPLWAFLGLAIPGVIAYAIVGTWSAAVLGVLWGGLVRVFFVHHTTWSINSVCHIWGSQPFACNDESRNNAVFGVLALGEGWHNNHHAFPTSARHGLRWWQVDLSYGVIWTLARLGLARDVRLPTPAGLLAKARQPEPTRKSA